MELILVWLFIMNIYKLYGLNWYIYLIFNFYNIINKEGKFFINVFWILFKVNEVRNKKCYVNII